MPGYYRILILAALALCGASSAGGQNLVPNYSFELRNNCPTGPNTIPFAPSYNNFPFVQAWVSPSQGTPDYYHACVPSGGTLSVPNNGWGYRPSRTGLAIAGGYNYLGTDNTGEYIETKLTTAMVTGHTYHLHFYCVPGPIPPDAYHQFVAVDKIGALFSGTQINNPSLTRSQISAVPAISSPAGVPITDTVSWTRVSGFYSPLSNEQWLILGRFDDGLPVAQSPFWPSSATRMLSYYYYDDVVLKDVLTPDLTRSHISTIPCGSATTVLNGPAGADEYSWNTGSTAPSITVNGPGTWWVRSWTDTTYAVDTFRVTRAAGLDLRLPADRILCPGIPYTITPNRSFSTYLWSTGATTPSITVSQPGRYILTASDSCGSQTDTMILTARPLLQLPPDTAICNGDTITISANLPFASYLWSNGAVTPFARLSQAGRYTLTITDICGAQQDSFRLTVRPPVPPPAFRDTALCQGAVNPQLKVTGDGLRWYTSTTSAPATTQPSINTAATGRQTLYVSQTKDGCESSHEPFNIEVVTRPSVALGPDTTLCNGYILFIGAAYPLSSVTLRWSSGQTYSPIQVTAPGYYQLTAANACGSASDEVLVSFTECDSSGHPVTHPTFRHDCLIIPTAFTPNNDGKNDAFRVGSRCALDDYSIRIYSRWGAIIYEGNNISASWDGTVKGNPAPTGTYFYIIRYLVARSGNVYDQVKGDVTLVR